MPTSALRDVELATTGTWQASTGPAALTPAYLEAMLAAASDTMIDRAPLKFGHASALNGPLGDGEPAFGWVIPKRIGPSKASPGEVSLFGDVVGIPGKLAEVIPVAYRRRSIEVAYAVKARSGKTYAAVLTALALLGVSKPAVKGLADVVALYSDRVESLDHLDRLEVVEGLEGNTAVVAMLAAARDAGVEVATLDRMASAAGARDTASIPPPVAEPDQHDPQPNTRPGGQTMPATLPESRVRELLAQESDVDVEATLAGLRGSTTEPPAGDPPATGDPAPAPAPAPAPTPGDPAPAPAPAQPGTPGQPEPTQPPAEGLAASGAVATLSAGTLAELQRDAAWARTQRRDGIVDTAVREGKIAPTERTLFRAQLETNEEGTTAIIAGLAPRFATRPAGADNAPSAELGEGPDDAAWADFEASTFGIEQPAKA